MITQTPWFERKFDFNFPVGLFPIILERLRGTVSQLEASIKNIPEEQLIIKIDGKWSVKEVIGHLYDLEELWHGRIDDFLAHKEVLRAADLKNTKTHEAGHNSRTVETLLNQFIRERKKLIERVKNIISSPAKEWDVIATEQPDTGKIITGYVLPLAGAAALAAFIGYGLIGVSYFGVRYAGINYGISQAVSVLVGALVGVFISAFVIDALAPSFGSEKNMGRSVQLVAYYTRMGWWTTCYYPVYCLDWSISGVVRFIPVVYWLA